MVLKYIRSILVFLLFISISAQGQQKLTGNTLVDVKFPANIIAGEVYSISISIDGNLAEGPGRLSVVLPEGFALQKDFESVGDVSSHNQFVNIVWGVLPKDEIFKDSFRIMAVKPKYGTLEIEWRFTFLSYGEFETLKFTDKVNVVKQGEYVKSNLNNTQISSRNYSSTQNSRSTYSKPRPQTSYSSRNSSGELEYFIQISSSSSPNKGASLNRELNLEYPIMIKKSGNVYKYNVGPFRNYGDALNYAKHLNSQYDLGCFVVKYRGDTRVK